MLLPEIKEREYRFKLALRMGLPIFALILAFILSTFITTFESLQLTFYFTAFSLLFFSVYFIFFLIYKGFDERITEYVSKTFTREYLYKYLRKKIRTKKEYTLMLFSINNLHNINTHYGIKNGDKVLYDFVQYISKYLKEKNIRNFPMGHVKGGDFIIGLEGKKEEYNTLLELFCLKSNELKINDIEINISGAITDTNFSNDLEYMIENLFDIQEENKTRKILKTTAEINPNDLEIYVIDAIKNGNIHIMAQNIYENNTIVMKEYFSRLKDSNGKIIYPKSYMKVVKKLGLTAEYDYLMLEKSIINYSQEKSESFCITIHPTSLRNRVFLDKVQNILRTYPNVKEKIVFIISEWQYYSHVSKFNATLQNLRTSGVKIALDKLGSLHTSFLYLRDLDVDIVRFDTLYTKDINNEKYTSILEGLNIIAHKKAVKTWLKMVENESVNNFAQTIGINYIQGKALSKIEEKEKI